jgi:hypothetical protein
MEVVKENSSTAAVPFEEFEKLHAKLVKTSTSRSPDQTFGSTLSDY